jgi:exopolysaccharide biosynthesis predicted pyruvyltransferase EpsI
MKNASKHRQTVLKAIEDWSDNGDKLIVKQFKYFWENIRCEDDHEQNKQAISEALEDLDREGKIDLLAFIDGGGAYGNVVLRLRVEGAKEASIAGVRIPGVDAPPAEKRRKRYNK